MNSFHTKLLMFAFAIVSFNNSYPQSYLSGLITYWNMDESNGSILIDCIGSNHASCNFNLNPDQNGRLGNSQYFDFTNKAVVANNGIYNFPANSSFSIVYWMKFTETQYGLHGGQDHIIISKGDWQTGGPYGALWASGINGSGKVNFLLSDDTGFKIDLEGDQHFNDGNWHFVACVRDDATDKSYLYADGEVVDFEYYDYTGSFTNSDNICIAHLMNQAQPEYYFMGSIDEIGIYNRALSYEEINYLKTTDYKQTGIHNMDNQVFSIFPVPATSNLNIAFKVSIEESTLEVINTSGCIFETINIPAGSGKITVPLDNLAPGTYICRIKNDRIDWSERFIIIK
jgi:hypothetical protein